jgi:hypothetical protein
MAEPDNLVLDILKELRAELRDQRTELRDLRQEMREGFERVDVLEIKLDGLRPSGPDLAACPRHA